MSTFWCEWNTVILLSRPTVLAYVTAHSGYCQLGTQYNVTACLLLWSRDVETDLLSSQWEMTLCDPTEKVVSRPVLKAKSIADVVKGSLCEYPPSNGLQEWHCPGSHKWGASTNIKRITRHYQPHSIHSRRKHRNGTGQQLQLQCVWWRIYVALHKQRSV